MWPFKNKNKCYCVQWINPTLGGKYVFTDYVKATDIEHAIKKVRSKERCLCAFALQSIKVCSEETYNNGVILNEGVVV